ncbi:dephospho-CoA kinase [Arhodomonas sp. AD133]|uniref:dephospho-CoA kinase n=1 Tax=Arhodomonas sp. AD133 TaxID=3415009 RepID=UPI003EB90CF3
MTLVIGLTGGIASGKTTVARAFDALGADVVDTDEIAREVVEPGSEGLKRVVDAFGEEVLDDSGTLDRTALRRRIFADPDARERLEAILHPRIETRVHSRIAESRRPYVVLVVPLLVESGWDRLVDRVLVVDVDEDDQIARLQVRDGSTADEARAALAAQTDRASRLSRADDILDNRASADTLHERVRELHQRYLHLARDRTD